MTAAYKILSKVYQGVSAGVTSLVGNHVYTDAQQPLNVSNPSLHIFIRTATESTTVGVLTDTFIDFVARSNFSDGDGSELANIFVAADSLVNGVFFKNGNASGKLTRAGIPVGYGTYDEEQKDYFKRWTYRVIVKQQPTQ